MFSMRWVLEDDIFGLGSHPLRKVVLEAGHKVTRWNDDWWLDRRKVPNFEGPVVFHGSLGNASRIAKEKLWSSGAYCNTEGFHCSRWYPKVRDYLLNLHYIKTTVRILVDQPLVVCRELPLRGNLNVFVRPDSPLKPFSGRVVPLGGLTSRQLDHGFYYVDLDLPIIVAPVRELGAEYRFVVVANKVVASNCYTAKDQVPQGANDLAIEISSTFESPDPVYVLDIVETDGGYALLEINPFSGADLYECDLAAIVAAIGYYEC